LCCTQKNGSNSKVLQREDISLTANDSILLVSVGESQRIGFYLPDKLDKELYPYILDSREPQSKIKKIVIDHASFLLGSSLWLIPYYVHPGEKLNVFVNADGLAYLSIDENYIRNNELNFFVNLHVSVNRKINLPKQRTPQNIFSYSNLLLAKQRQYSIEYFRKNKVSANFMDIVETYLYDEYLSNVLGVYSNKKNDYNVRFPDDINLEAISKGLNLRNPKVESFAFYKCMFGILEYFTYQKDDDNGFRDGLDSCKKYFRGDLLEYAKFRVFDMFMDKNPKEYNLYLSQFLDHCHDSSYVQTLRENYKPYKKHYACFADIFFDETVESAGNESLKWKDVLSKYKGKIIVLDFWARWCVPCIEELPYIKKLKESLDKERIAIVLVSIDVNMVTWRKGLKENGLEAEKDSYLIINSSKSLILKKYKIEHVPRYIILNNAGDVIVSDAPRPSQGDYLKTILQTHINKL
jgi:thiol-disulfide isomerase/thioredoxin